MPSVLIGGQWLAYDADCSCATCVYRRRMGESVEGVTSKAQAQERAMVLLRSLLIEPQLKDLEKTGTFCIRGSNGRLYRIVTAGSYSTYPFIDGRGYTRGLHFRTDYATMPAADAAIGAMLHLKHNARRIEEIACLGTYNSGYDRPTDYKKAI